MKELFDKLSSYNIFNYLFPGVLFSSLVTNLYNIKLIQEDLLSGVFFYYYIGLVVSRFGSLVIEPLLKKISFLKFADYKEYIIAAKNDEKIEILSESNNMYRTLVAMFTLIGLLKAFIYFESLFTFMKNYDLIVLIFLLFLMFLFSYRKQTNYIVKRIKSRINE